MAVIDGSKSIFVSVFLMIGSSVCVGAIDPNAVAKSQKDKAPTEEDLLSTKKSKGIFSQKVEIEPPKTFEREDQPSGSSPSNQIQRPQAQEMPAGVLPSVPYNKKANRRSLPWETAEDREVQVTRIKAQQEGSFGLTASTGFSNSYYQSRLFLLYRAYSWLRVGFGAGYRVFDKEKSRESVVSPAFESVLSLPFELPIMPFLAAELGFDNWRREFDNVLVESGSSPYSDLSLGVSIPLNNYVNLTIKQSSHVYLSKPPSRFQNNGSRERYAETRLSAGFGLEL